MHLLTVRLIKKNGFVDCNITTRFASDVEVQWKMLIVQSIRRLGGEIGVPSCARRPALLSVQVAIHLQSHHKDVFTPRQRTQHGPASSSGTRSWTGQLTKPQWLLPPRLTSQSPTAWSHIREQAGG
jgi:hypothetical protein